MPAIDVAGVFLAFIVLLFSLTVHESAHAWAADRLGDPTARMLGRVSLNPIVHADLIGTVLFPIVAMITGAPLIGWAKPTPVTVRRLRHPRRDYVLVTAAGPLSNLALAIVADALIHIVRLVPESVGELNVTTPITSLLVRAVQLNVLLAVFNMIPIPPLDGGNILSGLLPLPLARGFDRLRPYGFLILYALMFTGGLEYVVFPLSNALLSWLP